jgi:hypothetical protein
MRSSRTASAKPSFEPKCVYTVALWQPAWRAICSTEVALTPLVIMSSLAASRMTSRVGRRLPLRVGAGISGVPGIIAPFGVRL